MSRISRQKKSVSKSSPEQEVAKGKDLKKDDRAGKKERTKDEKRNKSKDAKHDSNQKSPKEGKRGSLKSHPNTEDCFCKRNEARDQSVFT